jgi:hypothetical protein
MAGDMSSATANPSDSQLALFRRYVLLVQRVERFAGILWVPFFSPAIPFLRVPVFRWAVRAFVSRHIEWVVEQLDRCYQLRLATDPSGADDWKKLSDQAEAMDAGLPPFVSGKWALILAVLIFVFLTGKIVPAADFTLIAKMMAAIVTVSPDKMTELAAEPGIRDAFLRMVGIALAMSVAAAPVVIYHFRFKRILFNCSEAALAAVPGNATIFGIWKEQSVSAESVSMLERDLFSNLGEPAPQEIAVDLLAVILFFLYPVACGVVTGIVGWKVRTANRSTGYALLACGVWLLIIGGFPIGSAIREMRKRAGPLESECQIQAQK